MDASGGAREPALVRWSVSLSLALPFKTITSAAARGGRAREREKNDTLASAHFFFFFFMSRNISLHCRCFKVISVLIYLLMKLKRKHKHVQVPFPCFLFKLVVKLRNKVKFCAHYNVQVPTENSIAPCLQPPLDVARTLFLGWTYRTIEGEQDRPARGRSQSFLTLHLAHTKKGMLWVWDKPEGLSTTPTVHSFTFCQSRRRNRRDAYGRQGSTASYIQL